MMDHWSEGHRRFPASKFGTVPARKCQNVFPERHQPHYPPVYYDAQQNYNRESGYWTVPGCRTGGILQEYTDWSDRRHPSYPPVYLDHHHVQQHKDHREYDPSYTRDSRDLMVPQRAGSLREDWQRRYESSGSAHCTRESTKRGSSSIKELEAWAARYSHSLPRMRRIESELQGPAQKPEEDYRGVALRPLRSFSGPWDRAVRQPSHIQPPATYPGRSSAEKAEVIFSQPPGYIAPPAYDGPHQRSPGKQTWEDENSQSFMSRATLHPSAPIDPRWSNKQDSCFQEFKGRPLQVMQETLPNVHYQKNTLNNKTSKVIEGRKFSINKKMGGFTIFCLVSRTAATTESPNNTTSVSRDLDETQKIADEVDFNVPTLKETPQVNESEEVNTVGDERGSDKVEPIENEAQEICEKQISPSKYPLWKEPSLSSKCEHPSYQGAGGDTTAVESVSKNADSGLSHLVVDKTRVVVKVEMVLLPKKSLVNYMGSSQGDTEKQHEFESVEAGEKSESRRESLEERAERILGIPLHNSAREVPPDQEEVEPREEEKEEEAQDGATLRQNIEPVGSEGDKLVASDEGETKSTSSLTLALNQQPDAELSLTDKTPSPSEILSPTAQEDEEKSEDKDPTSSREDLHVADDVTEEKSEDKDQTLSREDLHVADDVTEEKSEDKDQTLSREDLHVADDVTEEKSEDKDQTSSREDDVADDVTEEKSEDKDQTSSREDLHVADDVTEEKSEDKDQTSSREDDVADDVTEEKSEDKDQTSSREGDVADDVTEEKSEDKDQTSSREDDVADDVTEEKSEDKDQTSSREDLHVADDVTEEKSEDKDQTSSREDDVADDVTEEKSEDNDQTSPREDLHVADDVTEENFEDDKSISEGSLSEKQELEEIITVESSEAQESDEYVEPQNVGNGCLTQVLSHEEIFEEALKISDETTEQNPTTKEEDSLDDQEVLMEAVVPSDDHDDAEDGSSREDKTEEEAEDQSFGSVLGEEKSSSLPSAQDEECSVHQESNSPDVESQTCSTDSPTLRSSSQAGNLPEEFGVPEESEYPRSLWDAVNRIRRHTAPDSENEEEEVGELWDPECGGQEVCPDVVFELQTREDLTISGETSQAVTAAAADDVTEEEPTQTDVKPQKIEDDTISCCSHDSGDTVIDAVEDEASDTTSGADKEFLTEGEESRSTTDAGERTSNEEEDKSDEDAIEGGERTSSSPGSVAATPPKKKVITETMTGLDNL